jgi:hypothetical protein
MPALADKCVDGLNSALTLASATEALWLAAPPAGTIRQQLKASQLEALYEATFLRQFTVYEAFVEELLVHQLARYPTSGYIPVAAVGRRLERTVKAARAAVYDGQRYLLWHNPAKVRTRVARFLDASTLEKQLLQHEQTLQDLAAVRHHIAHGSADSRANYLASARRLTGVGSPGTVGHLLRASDVSDPLNPTKWIRRMTDSLADVVRDLAG